MRGIGVSIFFLLVFLTESTAQNIPALTIKLKKPAKLENKQLGSEKTGEKKFNISRRIYQNTVTHFNWYFNANEKLKEVIARAKEAHKDDYASLLSFYNYDLQHTAGDSLELDSVIYKANAGILIHDLRNDWIDDLYLLLGQAYYYRQTFDTAFLTFQYVNYAFAPKEKDGYDKLIGSNAVEGGNAFSIATPDETSFSKKVFYHPSSRNMAFLWQVKNFLAQHEYTDATGILEILKNDPQFPVRLQPHLAEMQALWFYQQDKYDSAAFYLEKALPLAENREEKARWEYLIAQLYERSAQHEAAYAFYQRSYKHTLNPVLEIYGRLNSIRQRKGDSTTINANIETLTKMAKRDLYSRYRNIIYYAAAQMELERPNEEAAIQYLQKSVTSTSNMDAYENQKSRSFLLLGDLHFNAKAYKEAKRNYDSVDNINLLQNPEQFEQIKSTLSSISLAEEVIARQDSLQKIAALSPADRDLYIKKLIRKIRKEQGLKEEAPLTTGSGISNPSNTGPAFVPKKGEWYFSNADLKAKGQIEFKNIWGNRPNVDNWRRQDAVKMSLQQQTQKTSQAQDEADNNNVIEGSLSEESLIANLPLSPEKLKVSEDSVTNALLQKALLLKDGLEDYTAAIPVLLDVLDRMKNDPREPEVLFHLYYAYIKTGHLSDAQEVKAFLKKNFANSDFIDKIELFESKKKWSQKEITINQDYEKIYNQYLAGDYKGAKAAKAIADSLYGNIYWTPQLLYIQAVAQINERSDSLAIGSLQEIINRVPSTPMAEKAQNLIDILGKRADIEAYLQALKIEPIQEDSLVLPIDEVKIIPAPKPEPKKEPLPEPPAPATKEIKASITEKNKPSNKKQDIVISPSTQSIDSVGKLVKQPNAIVSTTVKDTLKTTAPSEPVTNNDKKPVIVKSDSSIKNAPVVKINPPTPVKTTAPMISIPVKEIKPSFEEIPNQPHYVMLLTDQVDGIFVGEAKNAFNRYNKQKINAPDLLVSTDKINDTQRLLMIGAFKDQSTAWDYLEKIKKLATTEIIPWLPANKYRIYLISQKNLDLLLKEKNIENFKTFIEKTYPGKF